MNKYEEYSNIFNCFIFIMIDNATEFENKYYLIIHVLFLYIDSRKIIKF